jgi:hypothetical protein
MRRRRKITRENEASKEEEGGGGKKIINRVQCFFNIRNEHTYHTIVEQQSESYQPITASITTPSLSSVKHG